MRKKSIVVSLVFFMFGYLFSEELPRPTYNNSLIFSMTYSLTSSSSDTEVAYMKSQFGNGLYAPLACSTFLGVNMDWHRDIAGADNGIQSFKNMVDSLVEKARTYGIGLHFCITYGLSRNPQFYDPAKDEDTRNAQWYNDNNIAAETQVSSTRQPGEWIFDLNKINHVDEMESRAGTASVTAYALGTHSRYARKLRNHLEAKVEAAFAYLKQVQDQYPDLLLVISGPGEAEMNLHPVNTHPHMQDYFCDYSPFAVLEFRDWIKHEGLYADGQKYAGEGCVNGGSRYQGTNGLQHFNQDFNTSFTTWDLKYFNWNLSDPVDTDYPDNINPDPNVIPVTDYTFDGMMPTSGPNVVNGGFDPPRVMLQKGVDAFWDLWQLFRETMVAHYVKDIAAIARESGITRNHYYTHQIPADYLFSTRPDDPAIPYLNPRYYSSASPLWTANAYNDTGVGVTMYDIHFRTWYAQTSKYILPGISSMSGNWGAMEYNPEILPKGFDIEMASAQYIYEQIMRLYHSNVHFIGFYRWTDSSEHMFKGNNREAGAKLFFDAVKDKARQAVSTVFTPRTVEGFTGYFHSTTDYINLSWSQLLWSDLNFNWKDWGDFKEFVLYRGYTENFLCNSSTEIARTTDYTYNDSGFSQVDVVYYKIAGVNVNGEIGNTVTVGVNTGGGNGIPILEVSRTKMNMGASTTGAVTPSQTFLIRNTGSGVLNWSVSDNADWLTCSPTSGINSEVVTVTVSAGDKSAGTYTAAVTISAPNANDSPRTLQVTLIVYNAGQDSSPFGIFETPLHGSTVRSSVPFTGWVLDDIGVESVKIYRQQGGNRVYIGSAHLVEGARPDVENTYPQYPNNSCAGWGYMMLTNFLPNNGNGTFTFHAIAADSTGHQKTLGTKTVTCDNANAVKPFGAIDTPTQGGTASGSSFRNHGWVLTPLPNTIPITGSTINIYVDGVYLGHPVYNIYRSDVASLFPGYTNSNGSHAYFDINTTAYANGVHTIYWTAQDNAGNADGIGSRYFTIYNSHEAWGMAHGAKRKGSPAWAPNPEGIPGISNVPIDYVSPIEVIKGYKRNVKPSMIYPGTNGNITIDMRELQRIEVRLFPVGTVGLAPLFGCAGYQFVGHRLRPLPIGSTLDTVKGIFYWQPPLAFIGKYTFVFVRKDKTGTFFKTNVTIKIGPRFPR
jgi:hypothetical protein